MRFTARATLFTLICTVRLALGGCFELDRSLALSLRQSFIFKAGMDLSPTGQLFLVYMNGALEPGVQTN